MSDITQVQAEAVVEAANHRAVEIGAKMDIGAVDAGGTLKGFRRMDVEDDRDVRPQGLQPSPESDASLSVSAFGNRDRKGAC